MNKAPRSYKCEGHKLQHYTLHYKLRGRSLKQNSLVSMTHPLSFFSSSNERDRGKTEWVWVMDTSECCLRNLKSTILTPRFN